MKIDRRVKHGYRKTKIYGVWASMKNRCYNLKCPCWQHYGQKNIRVCVEWLDFKAFVMWARTSGYVEGLYLDRIKNHLGYGPENCKWSTPLESTINRGATKLNFQKVLEIRERAVNGEKQKNIAVNYGVSKNIINRIINRKSWKDT